MHRMCHLIVSSLITLILCFLTFGWMCAPYSSEKGGIDAKSRNDTGTLDWQETVKTFLHFLEVRNERLRCITCDPKHIWSAMLCHSAGGYLVHTRWWNVFLKFTVVSSYMVRYFVLSVPSVSSILTSEMCLMNLQFSFIFDDVLDFSLSFTITFLFSAIGWTCWGFAAGFFNVNIQWKKYN